ncbi:MAG TPA: hypothetical protein VGK15_03580 [Candidatus Limnocylindria bacterium]|jgi:hypothetical protein
MTRPALLAWSLCALALAVAAAGVAVHVVSWNVTQPATLTPRGFALLLAVTFAVVGAFVASREPRNAVGWIFAVTGVSAAAQYAAEQVAYLASAQPPSPLLAPAAIVVFILGPTNSLATGIGLLYLFPTGHFLDRRDRIFAIAGIASSVVAVVASVMILERLPVPWAGIPNPLARQSGTEVALAIPGVTLLAIIGSTAMGVRALIRRFRHSTGVERQQLKWFVFVGTIVGVTLALTYVVLGFTFYTASGEAAFAEPPLLVRLTVLLNIASFVLIPPALGVAILRYRLYDIDVIINRALVYGATTVGLAAAFLSGIILLQALLRPITGGSEIAVAASTLVSVAIAQPLRTRIQAAVDRRFYRARYDAARTLDAFSARLRDEVALDAVRADLLDAVRDTVQPAHASVWLR